jgi:hypothetical protein
MGSTKQELATRQSAALARPSFIKEGDTRGTENIGSNDIKPPALRIAQAMSPETKRSEGAVYIDGLVEGLMFNSATREIFGEGPIGLVILNQLGHRHIEFAPKNEGGGVVDFNVPDGDPRTQFTLSGDGKTRLKPIATKFYDYLVWAIPEDGRQILMTLSLKSTQLKKAVQLNTILAGAKLPSFAHLFSVSAVPEKRGGNSFYGWRFDPVGYVSEAQYTEAGTLYDKMKGVNITIADEGVADEGDDSSIPF